MNFNLLGSRLLSPVQTSLLHFWEKTSHKLAAIHESFRGGHHSAFSSVQVRGRGQPPVSDPSATPPPSTLPF